jgi:hypothetical protein
MPMNVLDTQESKLHSPPAGTAKTAVRISTLRSVADVEGTRELWKRSQRHPNSDIDHYLSTIDSLSGVLRPHVILAHRDEVLEAMLVGRLERKHVDLRLGYSSVIKLHVQSLTFIYGGLLGQLSSESANNLAREIAGVLRRKEADVVFFNHLRLDSPLLAALSNFLGFWTRDHVPVLQTHRAMTLPAGVDEFWRRFSTKTRKNHRWQAKKLLNDYGGDVRIQCFRETNELDLMIREVERVAEKTYQRGLGVGFANDEITRKLLRLKAERGWLRAYLLYIRGCPAAFWLGTLYSGTFHSDAMGYHEEFGKYSPGMYLLMSVIEGFCVREGNIEVSSIDFGLGDAQYKEMFSDVSWQDASFYVYAPNLRGAALNALRTPIALLDQAAKTALERSQLIQRVKTAWRRRVRDNIGK